MLSPHHISKGAAVALAVGAFAAPVASAQPIGGFSPHSPSARSQLGIPPTLPALNASQSAAIRRAEQQAAHGRANTLPNARFSTAATNAYPSAPSGPLTGYSPQDKQISPHPVLPAWASAGAAASQAGVAPDTGGGFDWGDAGIGAAGGLVLSVVAIGGGLVLVERRPRRTKATAVATG